MILIGNSFVEEITGNCLSQYGYFSFFGACPEIWPGWIVITFIFRCVVIILRTACADSYINIACDNYIRDIGSDGTTKLSNHSEVIKSQVSADVGNRHIAGFCSKGHLATSHGSSDDGIVFSSGACEGEVTCNGLTGNRKYQVIYLYELYVGSIFKQDSNRIGVGKRQRFINGLTCVVVSNRCGAADFEVINTNYLDRSCCCNGIGFTVLH